MRSISLLVPTLAFLLLSGSALAIIRPRDGHPIPDRLAVFMQDIRKDYPRGRWAERMAGRRLQRESISIGLMKPSALSLDTFAAPVLAGRYADATPTYTRDDFQALLFDGPNATGTMTEYYREVSYSQFELSGGVYGWYTAPQTGSYYINDPSGEGLAGGGARFARDVVVNADPDVDLGQFDNDGPDGLPNSGDDDGYVDVVIIVHAGAGGEWTDVVNLWSHRWNFNSARVTYPTYMPSGEYTTNDPRTGGGFIRVNDYTLQPELSRPSGGLIEIGVFCHEFGHVLGLPDLYDEDYSSSGLGGWCLMASGNYGGNQQSPESPSHMSAWPKEQLGWISPVVVTSDRLAEVLPSAERDPIIYKLWRNGAPGAQYFLIENRQRTGLFDKSLVNSGLLIFHVDNARGNNRDENHYMVDLEQADGERELNLGDGQGDAGDPFPGSGGIQNPNRNFDRYSMPNSNDYDNLATGVAVYNVRQSDSLVTADLLISVLADVSPIYVDASVTAGITDTKSGFGALWADYDSDGFEDIFLTKGQKVLLYHNNKDGTFTDVASAAGLSDLQLRRGASWVDYDNDGDLDLYVLGYNAAPTTQFLNQLRLNDGDGTFSAVAAGVEAKSKGQAAAWADYDNDGYADLYVINDGDSALLYKNSGEGSFANVTVAANAAFIGSAQGLGWADYDNDGDLDLYISTKAGSSNVLYRNNGDATFTDVAASAGVADTLEGRGVAWGDYDNNGTLDLFVANSDSPNRLYRNNGDGTFSEVGATAGVDDGGICMSPLFLDFDNDGDLDLFVSRQSANRLFENQGNGKFLEVGYKLGVGGTASSRGAAFGEMNNDGYPDVFVANGNAAHELYRNLGSSNNWLGVRLVGQASNASAIGARVVVVAGGKRQLREVHAGSGYMSHSTLDLMFGLGTATMVDSLIMRWPSGVAHVFANVPADQKLVVREITTGVEELLAGIPKSYALYQNYPNPFNPSTVIAFDLPRDSHVTLKLYDLLGQEVMTVVEEDYNGGSHTVEVNLSPVASGVYFYRLTAGTFTSTKKMVLVK